MASHAAVGVHDNLATRETCVAHRAANHKSSRRIDVVLGVLVQPLGREHGLDYVLEDVCVQLLVAYAL